MIFFLTASFFLLITFLKYIDLNGIKKTSYYLPIVLYSISAIISTFMAEYKEIVIKGFPDRYENIFVLLGYLLLVVVVINIIDDQKSFKLILKALFISAFILSIHGILQFYNYDLFATEFGRRLITPDGLEFFVDRLSFIGKRVIYSTMYNPNYVGSYASMVGILVLGLIAFSFGTAVGVLFGKLMYEFSGGKVNPLIGAAGVSAVPMAARVVQKVGQEENPSNHLLMHAMGPNFAGVIGSAIAAGTLLSILG